MLIAAFTLVLVVALAGALLLVARRLLPPPAVDQLVDRVHALLPQTQCEQCGQPGCRPYAVAVIGGEAANRCAPGGEPVARAIALLLARPILNAAIVAPGATVARIREDACIGCTRCIPVCPVDVILGATQYMHTVLEAECTGCGLCIAPCPVDCIDLVPVAPSATRTDSVLPPSGADVQASAHERAPLPPAAPCINCGKCAAACPAALQPQALLRLLDAQDIGAAARLGMSACTECGACDTVCPSSIPLRARFVAGRTAVAVHVAARHAASNAGARFARHERRRAAADDVRARKRAQRLAHRHVLATDTDND